MEFLIPRFLVDTGDLINQAVTEAKLARVRALVRLVSAQVLANGAATFIDFDTEVFDGANLHDNVTNPSRFTVPSGYTVARLTAGVELDAGAVGERTLTIYKNGARFAGGPSNTMPACSGQSGHTINVASGLVEVTPGDYFQVGVWQNSGAGFNVKATNPTFFAIELWE